MQDHFHIIRSELVDHQRRRATLEAQEAELEGQLATHNAEYEATGNDLSELVAMGDNRVRLADAAIITNPLGTLRICIQTLMHSVIRTTAKLGSLSISRCSPEVVSRFLHASSSPTKRRVKLQNMTYC